VFHNQGMEHDLASDSKLRGRPREFDLDEALDRAIDVFRQRGYTAASLAELAQGMGLSRGSLYKAFNDKQSLFLAAYDRYADFSAQRLEAVVGGPGSARDRIGAVLDLYARLSQGEEGGRGCLVVATAMELAVAEPAVAQRVLASWRRTERGLLKLMELGRDDGSIPDVDDRAGTVRAILCLLQGMRLVGKGGAAGSASMKRVAEQAMRLLG